MESYTACKKGVRQGDPLSPIHIDFAKEVFNKYISYLKEHKQILPMESFKGIKGPYILYENYIFVFLQDKYQIVTLLFQSNH